MNRSARLILLGVLIILLAAVRMATDSSDSRPVGEWGDVDQEGVQQTLTPGPVPASLQPESASPTASSVPEASAVPFALTPSTTKPPNPTSQTQARQSTVAAANRDQGEPFLSPSGIQRTVQPSPARVPVRVMIPAIGLDAPVVQAKSRKILLQGDVFDQWIAPNQFTAGWIVTSALLGEPGNTVISGHHNEYGEVFGRLIDVNVGDTILLFSDSTGHSYMIVNKMILQELDVPVSQRIKNARWIGRSNDERLTMVTCWPKETNTHRLIVAASPN